VKEHQRQLILLIAVMTFLTTAFLMVLSQSPDAFQIDAEPENQSTANINQSLELPGPVNSSVSGLKQLYEDASKGLKLGVKASDSS
jgi:hypothetical protein